MFHYAIVNLPTYLYASLKLEGECFEAPSTDIGKDVSYGNHAHSRLGSDHCDLPVFQWHGPSGHERFNRRVIAGWGIVQLVVFGPGKHQGI